MDQVQLGRQRDGTLRLHQLPVQRVDLYVLHQLLTGHGYRAGTGVGKQVKLGLIQWLSNSDGGNGVQNGLSGTGHRHTMPNVVVNTGRVT